MLTGRQVQERHALAACCGPTPPAKQALLIADELNHRATTFLTGLSVLSQATKAFRSSGFMAWK